MVSVACDCREREGCVMPGFIHTHPLLRPIIAADNREWRARMRKEREETRTASLSALNDHQTISDAILMFERKGGMITRLPDGPNSIVES